MSARICAVRDCGVKIRAGYLMCGAHWRMIPLKEQRAVNRAWRTLLAGGGLGPYNLVVKLALRAVEAEIARSLP